VRTGGDDGRVEARLSRRMPLLAIKNGSESESELSPSPLMLLRSLTPGGIEAPVPLGPVLGAGRTRRGGPELDLLSAAPCGTEMDARL